MLYRLVALAAIIATGAGAPVQDHGLDSRLHALEAKIHALEAEKVEAQSDADDRESVWRRMGEHRANRAKEAQQAAIRARISASRGEDIRPRIVILTKDMQKCLETRLTSVDWPVDKVEKKLVDKVLALFVEKTGQRPARARYEDLLSKGIDVLASKCVGLMEEPRKRRP